MASSSCQKCVSVLRELISGLQETGAGSSAGRGTTTIASSSSRGDSSIGASNNIESNNNESRPLTLLKAIARGQQRQQQHQLQQDAEGTTGQIRRQQHRPSQLVVEEVEDGVRLTIPVETTVPTLLRRWTKLVQDEHRIRVGDEEEEENDLLPLFNPLATSALVDDSHRQSSSPSQPRTLLLRGDDDATASAAAISTRPVADPLVVELKCRKCASTGPEGGARAFLMGPQPLSVVLCHNRIASHRREIEEILTHELVHLHDVQTMRLDLQDCESLAYSEIRAARAAECRDSWSRLQPYCVKQKAICATNNLFPAEGRKCIQRVFDTAFADQRPFDDGRPADS
jgi:Peptidase M76 family